MNSYSPRGVKIHVSKLFRNSKSKTFFLYPHLKFDFFRFFGSNQFENLVIASDLLAFFTWFIVLFEQIESFHTGGSAYGQASMLLAIQTVGFRGRNNFVVRLVGVSIVRGKRC